MISFSDMKPFGSMTWFNEPEKWAVENGTLTIEVTGQSDYWRVSHYGFTVDDGPFLYSERGDGFVASFSDFTIKHLPDARRLEWLESHK